MVEVIRSEWVHKFENTYGFSDSHYYDVVKDFEQICTMETIFVRCHSYLHSVSQKSSQDNNARKLYSIVYISKK